MFLANVGCFDVLEGALLEAAQVDGLGLVVDVGGESRQVGEPAIITGSAVIHSRFVNSIRYVVKQIFALKAKQ